MKIKSFIQDCGIFPFDILVFIGDAEGLMEECKDLISEEDLGHISKMKFNTSGKYIFNKSNNTSIIWLPTNVTDIVELAILNHEILHAVFYITELVDITLSESSEETYTYLMQYLMVNIYDKLGLKVTI